MELRDAFPGALSDIPEAARPPESIEPVWLVDGRVERWDGPTDPVTSPVAPGGREPIVLGPQARLGEEQARRAVAAAGPVVRVFSAEVARVNINDVCQRGPDSFGFTATDKSGFGILSLTEALDTFSRPVLMQSTSESTLEAATP